MKIVIDISEDEYRKVQDGRASVSMMRKTIRNGTPLPKDNDVLDKIRAEIEQLRLHKSEFLTNDGKVCIDSQEVLAIIDKYKAESEEGAEE